jgi:hypothetical protein
VKKARTSFLKKRSKKLLSVLVWSPDAMVLNSKSFLVLFFKKERLAFFPPDRAGSA